MTPIDAPAAAWTDALTPLRRHAGGVGEVDHVYVRTTKGTVRLSTTDGQSMLTRYLPAPTDGPASAYLPIEPLYETATMLEGEGARMSVAIERWGDDKERVRAKIESEGTFTAELNPDPHTAFRPTGPADEDVRTMDAEALRSVLERTSYAASTDVMQAALSGVYVNLTEGDVVATDGHELSLIELDDDVEWAGILPCAAAERLVGVLPEKGDVDVHMGETHFHVSWDSGRFETPLVDGAYPNYRQAMPSGAGTRIRVGREQLISVLERVSLYTPPKGPGESLVRFTPDVEAETMTVFGEDLARSAEATVTLPIEPEAPTVSIEPVRANAEYVQESAEHMSGRNIELQFHGPMGPIEFYPVDEETGGHAQALVMPVQPPS